SCGLAAIRSILSFPTRRASDLRAGDAMADDVVDRGADRLREAPVAHVGGYRLLHVDDVLVADVVQLLGADPGLDVRGDDLQHLGDRKSTRLNSSHVKISYAVFC